MSERMAVGYLLVFHEVEGMQNKRIMYLPKLDVKHETGRLNYTSSEKLFLLLMDYSIKVCY